MGTWVQVWVRLSENTCTEFSFWSTNPIPGVVKPLNVENSGIPWFLWLLKGQGGLWMGWVFPASEDWEGRKQGNSKYSSRFFIRGLNPVWYHSTKGVEVFSPSSVCRFPVSPPPSNRHCQPLKRHNKVSKGGSEAREINQNNHMANEIELLEDRMGGR